MPDLTVVGSGLAGSTIARKLAEAGRTVRVLERRDHIGGNCYDEINEKGVLIHKYGPHIFRSSNEAVINFLSEFTDWRRYEHRVLARTKKGLLPIPINATTLEKWFEVDFRGNQGLASWFLEGLQEVTPKKTSEDVCLSRVGRELYEEFFESYTMKQWGKHPRELDASICGRIPVRSDWNDRYFSEPFEAIPSAGYAEMFENMLSHPGIEVVTDVDAYYEVDRDDVVVWTGAIDQAMGYAHGELPWRSLRFEHEHVHSAVLVQEAAVINEPSIDVPYTRTAEHRWITGQAHSWTTLSHEFAVPVGPGVEPYYPVLSPESHEQYELYRAAAAERPNWTFAGRLGRFRYLEMGQAVGGALKTARELIANLPTT